MKEKTADIDILEDLLSTQKQYIEDKDYQKEHNINEQAIDYAKMWTKATENLIAENKELKEEIEELKKYEKYYEEMEEVNKKFIAVDKIKAMLENEIINISGFECVAKEDVQSLLGKE